MKRDKVRKNFGNVKRGRGSARILRPVLEPLEARRLLAGLNVNIFVDQNGSRAVDAADSIAPNRVVYLDLNQDGLHDAAEPMATSNDAGVAQFRGLTPGEYFVALAEGSATQSQSFPTRPDASAKLTNAPAANFIASADLARVWAFDQQGLGKRIRGGGGPISSVDIGGPIITSLQVSSNEAWVIKGNGIGAASKLTHFDVISGQHIDQTIVGLNGRMINKLVKAGPEIVAQLSGPNGIELARLSLVNGVPTIGTTALLPALTSLTGSPIQAELVVVSAPNSTHPHGQIARISAIDFTQRFEKSLADSVSDVTYSSDGQFVLVAQHAGGVQVFNNDAQLSQAAVLSEAISPLISKSRDGQIVTGSAFNSSELIVWNVNGWQPVGRTLASSGVTQVIVSSDGEELLAATPAGIFGAKLANAARQKVTVSESSLAEVTLGVRLGGENHAPTYQPVRYELFEDSLARGDLRSAVVDLEGDKVWFEALSAPEHGQLDLSPDGTWIYRPSRDFAGHDRALVKVFDGRAAAELSLDFNVLPVDDLPTELRLAFMPISENAQAGTLVGQFSVVDVDGGDYQFIVSDPRFVAGRNNQISVAANAVFDFESEPTISLELFAIDDPASGYRISTTATVSILDVNEPPTGIRIVSQMLVPENQPGAVIGSLEINDPDSVNNFTYLVSDSRFEVVNGYLQLKPNVSLDFEAAEAIDLLLSVTDESGGTVSTTVSVEVENRNDPPTRINVELNPVPEQTYGSIIGSIAVQDQDQQEYNYSISDNRFEVINGQIKLKDGHTLDKINDAGITLVITATDASGDSVSTTVDVDVHSRISPFQNPAEPRDVNGDGVISPIDALLVLDQLNKYGPRTFGPSATPGASGEGPHWVDVNGDGAITPIDILLIINYLNKRGRGTVAPEVDGKNDPPVTSPPPGPDVENKSPGGYATSTISTGGKNDVPLGALGAGEGEGAGEGALDRERVSPDDLQPPTPNFGFACPAFERDEDSVDTLDEELETLLEQLSQERFSVKRGNRP